MFVALFIGVLGLGLTSACGEQTRREGPWGSATRERCTAPAAPGRRGSSGGSSPSAGPKTMPCAAWSSSSGSEASCEHARSRQHRAVDRLARDRVLT